MFHTLVFCPTAQGLLGVSSWLFSRDSQKLVINPLEKMAHLVPWPLAYINPLEKMAHLAL